MPYELISKKFTTKNEIANWLSYLLIENYHIRDDLSVDTKGNVIITGQRGLEILPVQFNHIDGTFFCSRNGLKTLEGSPQHVALFMDCSFNELTTLEGAPKTIGGNFNFSSNQINSFEHMPQSVGGSIDAQDNLITSFEHFNCSFQGKMTLSYNFDSFHNDIPGYYFKIKGLEHMYHIHDSARRLILTPQDMSSILEEKLLQDNLKNVELEKTSQSARAAFKV